MCVNNLPKAVTWKGNGRETNLQPFVSWTSTLTITPPGHHTIDCVHEIKYRQSFSCRVQHSYSQPKSQKKFSSVQQLDNVTKQFQDFVNAWK